MIDKKRCKIAVLFLCFLFVASFVSAGILVSKSEIADKYNRGENIQGSISFSLSNEPKASKIYVKFSGMTYYQKELIDFLGSLGYTCVPAGCGESYEITGESFTSKLITLDEKKLIGIVLNGKGVEMLELSLDLQSDALSSCENQIRVDIADDGKVEWVNKKIVAENCGDEIKSSCNTGSFSSTALIEQVPYCEKFSLPEAPAFSVRAGITKQAGDFYKGLLKIRMYNSVGGEIGGCELSNPSGGFSTCIINSPIKEKGEHYVCVFLKEGVSTDNYKYRIKASPIAGCGFQGDPANLPELVASYDLTLFAQKFNAVGTFKIDKNSFGEQNEMQLASYLNDYLQEKYLKDCSNKCIIPMQFSGQPQKLDFSNLALEYKTAGISGLSDNKLYGLEKTPAKINSNSLTIELSDFNFKVPDKTGEYNLEIYLENQKIAEKKISVSFVQGNSVRQVYPKIAAAANPTNFIVFADSGLGEDIFYRWNFGDITSIETTSENTIKHTYSAIGDYSLRVDIVKDNSVIGTNTFKISVVSPKEAIGNTLRRYQTSLANVEKQLGSFSQQYGEFLEDDIDIEDAKSQLAKIDTEYKQFILSPDTSDEEYIFLMQEIVSLNIPLALQATASGEFVLVNNINDIVLSEIEELFDDDGCSDGEKCANAIADWAMDKVEGKLSHKVFSVYYPTHSEELFSEFIVSIEPIESFDYNGYLIVKEDGENVFFSKDFESISEGEASGIKFSLSGPETISFVIKSGVSVFEIPIYLAPQLNKLNVSSERQDNETKKPNKWLPFFLIFLIFVAGVFIYLFLKKWYCKNYESFLFKNPADLNNLLLFILNSKKKGVADGQIKEKLKKAGWKNEQIIYAFNRFYKKNTGMPEFPLKIKKSASK